MKKHRIINARNLAIAIAILIVAVAGTAFVLNNKINRLYAATVSLQTDLNNRCSVYEFVPEDGHVAGYLLKGSDGTLTFIGGGSEQNADELAVFIEKHGGNINKWYVYGEDDENSGAMRKIIRQGDADPEGIYVINTEEITEIK